MREIKQRVTLMKITMSKVTAINKIIEFRRNLYCRAYCPNIDEVSEMLDDIQKELENE